MIICRKILLYFLIIGIFLSLLPTSTVLAAQTPREGQRAVSVPSISSPFTTHPTVFIVEDTYQIAFATNANGLAWVEIGGVKYHDSTNGLMDWKSKYHKITVPQEALDTAGSYNICFRSLSERPSYDPLPGNTVTRTYPFDAIPQDREPVFYCASDQHGDNSNALKISKSESFDVYLFGGDYISTLTDDSGIKLLLDMTGSVTLGRKPTIYSRGNHEIRGSNCEDIRRVSGYSETTGAYYTLHMPGIFGLVLDCGEDKLDSHEEYGGTVTFQSYRDQQTRWLREVLKSRIWEKYPVRMAFCHVPFGFNATGDFESVYKEWTELLDQMGISLQISGHKHYYGFYGPNSSKYKSDPNYATVLMTDRENGDISYSATFITVGKTEYTVKNVLQNLSVKETRTAPIFTNAYVTEEYIGTAPYLPQAEEVSVSPAVRASVPSISSPYTLHPTVFAVEDGYQIIFTTEGTGMAWVEVGGTKYYDSLTGLMRYTSKYHSVRIPRVALDSARSYKINYQSMTYREAYSPTHGSTVSRTYPFTPMGDKKEPVILCLSDFRGLAAEAKAVAAYKTFDALYVGGDYAYNGNSEGNVKLLLDTASAIANGTKPVFFTRGNREIRGNYSYLLDQVTPTSKNGKSYYTVEQADFFAIVLDSGEDKYDSDAAYGSTVDYEKHRREQTQWLEQILAEGKWRDYPTRVAFCHMPIPRITGSALTGELAKWTALLNQMGISLLISGHNYDHGLYLPGDSSLLGDPKYSTLVSCDVDNPQHTYSGSYLTLGLEEIKVENVSAAKKLLKTSIAPNLTGPHAPIESDQYLMFDFVGDPVALDRYHSFVYGGINFDLKSNWDPEANTSTATVTRGSISFSPKDATVTSAGIHSRPGGNAKGNWAYRPLHYFPKEGDYCQVRFKIENAVASSADGTAKFRLDVDCPNDLNDDPNVSKTYTRFEQSFKAVDVVGKGYVTLSFPLNSAEYSKFQFLNLVHPQFVGLCSESGKTAVYTIDYLYIGPKENFPKQEDYLFFDFTDTEQDRQRYHSFTYNYTNFDLPSCWTAYDASPLSTIRDGALCLAVTSLNKDSSHSIRSHRDNVKGLHYIPGENDVLQVRLQIRNAAASNADGIVNFCMNFDRNNRLTLADGSSRTYSHYEIPVVLAEVVDQGWFTLELALTDWEYQESEWITLIHPQFKDVTNAKGKTAEFLIDYIYIGPEDKSPTANTVTFCHEDGTVLEEQKVATGEAVTYTGTTPEKGFDMQNHYSFAGWVMADGESADLHSVTESMVVYASFQGQGHSYEEVILTAPGCTTEGVKSLSCSCGYSYTEAVSAMGHSAEEIPSIPATCTEGGMSAGARCTVCDAVLQAPEATAPLGHEPQILPGRPADCLNSGLSDAEQCGRCGILLKEQEILPRLGHSYGYSDLGDKHLCKCTRCGKESTVSHSFVNGICVCGAVEAGAVELATLKLNHSLNLASDISVNLAVSKSLLAGFDMSTVYILSELDLYEGNVKVGSQSVKLMPVEQGSYYYFSLEGLTAVQMNDRIRSVLYGRMDGRLYCSPIDDYSICDYALSQMNKANSSQGLKVLCADLLRYGSLAQIYKSYRTDALADSSMTEEQRAYLSDMETLSFGNTNVTENDSVSNAVQWAGKALNLESKIAVKYIFSLPSYEGPLSELKLRVEYTDIYGNPRSCTVTELEVYNPEKQLYAFSFDGLLAAELRCVVSARIYGGDQPISATLRYSPDTYGNGKTGTLLSLCKALIAYSDSAKAYFLP